MIILYQIIICAFILWYCAKIYANKTEKIISSSVSKYYELCGLKWTKAFTSHWESSISWLTYRIRYMCLVKYVTDSDILSWCKVICNSPQYFPSHESHCNTIGLRLLPDNVYLHIQKWIYYRLCYTNFFHMYLCTHITINECTCMTHLCCVFYTNRCLLCKQTSNILFTSKYLKHRKYTKFYNCQKWTNAILAKGHCWAGLEFFLLNWWRLASSNWYKEIILTFKESISDITLFIIVLD